MASYYLNEAVLDLPERPFVDKTIHGLESKLPGDKTLGVLVHRRPIEGDKSLREVVAESVALNQKRLAAFTVIDEGEASVGGVPGVLLRTRWRNERATFYQLQAHVVRDGQAMIFAVTGPIDDQAACDETFESMMRTLTWRTE